MTEAELTSLLRTVTQQERCHPDEALALLRLHPESAAADQLRDTAHRKALAWSGGQGRVWFAIGLDSAPCPRNCAFCAMGEDWKLMTDHWRLDDDLAEKIIREHDVPGVGFIVLRTTDLYPLEDLLRLARRVTPLRHARLVANIGDLSPADATRLRAAGFSAIYHALRLREGVDTCLDPAQRRRTMQAAINASLDLAALADPIGAEHTDEEIVTSLFAHRTAGASIMGAMARVNVSGTPKAEFPMISRARLAQITAVARLVAGPDVPQICAHPPHETHTMAGANVVVVESGAIPRDAVRTETAWRAFTLDDGLTMLQRAGFQTA